MHYVVGEAVDMTQKSRKEKAVDGEEHRRLKRVKKTQKKRKSWSSEKAWERKEIVLLFLSHGISRRSFEARHGENPDVVPQMWNRNG